MQLIKKPVQSEWTPFSARVRLGQDVKAFANFTSFEHAITQVVEIAKQNEGWLKSQRQGYGQNRRAMPPVLATPSVP